MKNPIFVLDTPLVMAHGNSQSSEFAFCVFLFFFCFVLIFFLFSSFFSGNVPIMNKKAKFESRANQLLNAPKVKFFMFFIFLIHNIQIRCVFLNFFVFYDCICCFVSKE